MNDCGAVFKEFGKISRLVRGCIITEKIDGTNGVIHITAEGGFFVGSRNRWLSLGNDNFGFAKWADENKDELMRLGEGYHYGEWWGSGIQRRYGLAEKRFSLFNTARWSDDSVRPKCCGVVPIVASGIFSDDVVNNAISTLKEKGSIAAPGFMNPEGIVIYHIASRMLFKKTIEKDEEPKGIR